ncbi:MAG: pyridoxine 5'-phosphate synthase [Alistipes sp.]|nr:pyridoxine 5'-phosphate synthase [Candidatus Minthomonas equi]
MHTRLSVNINKLATVRNARGGNMPDILKAAKDIESYGAEGITVHPRPDERHIRYRDVLDLKPILSTEFNIEGNPIPSFTELVCRVIPTQVTLVPDAHDAITSNAGWDTSNPENRKFLAEKCRIFHSLGIRASIFIDPDPEKIRMATETVCDRLELYTAAYAQGYGTNPEKALAPYYEAALEAGRQGLGLNAGHDLSLINLKYFSDNIPELAEVSIGHALICEAIYDGLKNTVRSYLDILK